MCFLISFYDEFWSEIPHGMKILLYCLHFENVKQEALACKYYFYTPRYKKPRGFKLHDFDFFARFQYPLSNFLRCVLASFHTSLLAFDNTERIIRKLYFSTIPDTHTHFDHAGYFFRRLSLLQKKSTLLMVRLRHAERESLLNEYVLMKYFKNIHLSTIMLFISPFNIRIVSWWCFFQSEWSESSDKRYHFCSIFFNIIKLIGLYVKGDEAYYSYSDLTSPPNRSKGVRWRDSIDPVPADSRCLP